MKFHHIGVAVKDISATAAVYVSRLSSVGNNIRPRAKREYLLVDKRRNASSGTSGTSR